MKRILSIVLILLLLQGEAFARSSGRSYSSGGSSSFGHSSSSGSHFGGFGKSYSSGGGTSYSSGASRSKSYSYSSGNSSSGSSSFGSSKSYSSAGSNSFFGKSATRPKGNFNSGLTSAGQGEDSRVAYERHYNTPAGSSKTYTPADHARADRICTVDETRYRNYDSRVNIFYGNSRPTYYNDYWSPYLMGYLLSSSVASADRAAWVYHHRDSIDDSRYQELLARDAGLTAQLRQLESQNVQRDPNYVLPAMASDPDLMYAKSFVDSAHQHGPSVSAVVVRTLLVVSAVGVGIWLLFIREW